MQTIRTKYINLYYLDNKDKQEFFLNYEYKKQRKTITFSKKDFLNYFEKYDKNFWNFIWFLENIILKNQNIRIFWNISEILWFIYRLEKKYDILQKSYNLPKLKSIWYY